MAKTSKKIKTQKPPKYPVRAMNRCRLCGRPKAYIRQFGLCRLCFREEAHKGNLPGVTKASW